MSEFLDVAEQILLQTRQPMTPSELVDIAIRQKLFSDKIAGKTPHQTMKAKLSVHVRRQGKNSTFVRTSPGRFFLRSLVSDAKDIYEAPPLQLPNAGEQVLVFEGARLDKSLSFQGISARWKRYQRSLLVPETCRYVDRLAAETNDSFKQVVTYIMVTRGDAVLAYKRGSFNRTEDFLRGSHCIGFGGHVAAIDRNLFGFRDMGIAENVFRELNEELVLPEADRRRLVQGEGIKCVGVLNDDSSSAGQRHFAFLYSYETSKDPAWDSPVRGEKSITQLRWLTPDTKNDPIWAFEYWSQLCLRAYFPALVETTTAYKIVRRNPFRPPHIICVLGAAGSGKSEVTKLLSKEYRYLEINTGKVVAKLLGIPPIPQTRRDVFQKRAWRFIRNKNGPQRLAEAIWQQASKAGSKPIVVDGIRHQSTLKALKDCAKSYNIGLLYVHTLPDLAFQFYSERERKDDSVFDFLKLRRSNTEQEVETILPMSDVVLYNWTGKDRFRKIIRQLMTEILR